MPSLTDLLLNRFLYKEFKQNIETKDAVYDSVNNIPATIPALAAGSAAQDINTSNVYINGTNIQPGSYLLTVGDWGWGQTCAFTSASATQVNWGAGTFKTADGTTYSIGAGNTGAMSAKTYIYFDLNIPPVAGVYAYQHTTVPGDAVGIGKVVVAVAQNGSSAATYNTTEANQIVGDNILANSINASKIVSGSITTSKLSATAIDGMTITGAIIQTAYPNNTRIELDGAGNQINIYNGATRRARGYQNGWDWYNASGTLIAQTYADIDSYLISGAQTTSSIGLGVGATGVVSILVSSSPIMSLDSNGFYPTNASNSLDLGLSVRRWQDLWITGTASVDTALSLLDGAGTHRIRIMAPAVSAGWDLILPDNDGDANDVLTTDGSGNTSWAAAAGAGANTALSNLASVAINTSLISDTDNTDSLGSSSKGWKYLYLSDNIYYNNNLAFDFSTGSGIIWAGSANLANFCSYTHSGGDLGIDATRWKSLYLTTDIYMGGTIFAGGGAWFTSNVTTSGYLNSPNSQIIYLGGYNLNMNGTNKTAIVPTSEGFNALYAIESPDVWFMDFCDEKDKLDQMFKEVTVGPYKYIKCEGGGYQVWGKRKGHENIRFENKDLEDFEANERFLNLNKRAVPVRKLDKLN